jgi:hypothetical protein
MSKRIYNAIDNYLNENEFIMEDFLELLHELIVNDPIKPADKTVASRYSFVKNYLRKNYGSEFSEQDLKLMKPPIEIIDRIVNKDKVLKENKIDILFSKLDIDKILDLKNNKDMFSKFLYLMFISGRRMIEIKQPNYLLKLNRGNVNSIKMNLAKKKKEFEDKLFVVNLTPDTLTGKEFRSEVNRIREVTEDISSTDFNKRLNKKIKKLFPGKNWHSHTFRGLSAIWNYEKNNKENLSRNGYVMNWLNQDVLDSSLSYVNYKLVQEDII